MFKREIKYTPDSGYARAKRDISLIVSKKTLCVEIEDAARAASVLASDIRLIDSFESEKLGFGKKSLTFTITFSDNSADVTDEQADAETDKIVSALSEQLGAIRR